MRLKETFEDIDMYIILCYNLKQHPKYKHLYLNNKGKLINADVNGSLQIMKKVFPNVFNYGIEDLGLNPIRVSL